MSEYKRDANNKKDQKKEGKHGALCIACPTKMCVCWASSLISSASLVALWDAPPKRPPRYSFTGTIAHKAPEA